MNPLHLPPFIRHFWLLAVVANVANAIIFHFRVRRLSAQRPDLAAGYRRMLYGFFVYLVLPWLVMGVGIELGGVPNPFWYSRPQDGNPYVIAWYACLAAIWLAGFYWLFARRGAEFLVEHPGVFNRDLKSPAAIRAVYCLMGAGAAVGFYLVYTGKFAVPIVK